MDRWTRSLLGPLRAAGSVDTARGAGRQDPAGTVGSRGTPSAAWSLAGSQWLRYKNQSSVLKGKLPWLKALLGKKSEPNIGLSGEGSSAPKQGPPSDPKVNEQLGRTGSRDGGGGGGATPQVFRFAGGSAFLDGTLPSEVGDGSRPPEVLTTDASHGAEVEDGPWAPGRAQTTL